MTPYFDSTATDFIRITLYVLLALFFGLIIFVLVRRVLLKKWSEMMESSEEKILPNLYLYLDGEITKQQFSNNLNNRYEVIAAFRNITDMIDNFDGKQKKKLRSLLNLPQFNRYYTQSIRSDNTLKLAQACMYFEKKHITERTVINRLRELQYHEYPVIKYASTLALINTSDQDIRDAAFNVFIHNDGLASMAINDIIYKYCNSHDKSNRAADMLFRYITDPEVPVSNTATIVKMLPELGFYQIADDLVEFYRFPYQHDDEGMLTSALIDTLSDFSGANIIDLVNEDKTWNSDHTNVRLSTAKWIQKFYSEDLDPILLKLAEDGDLEVRIVAQLALTQSPHASEIKKLLNVNVQSEWLEILRTGGSYVDTD